MNSTILAELEAKVSKAKALTNQVDNLKYILEKIDENICSNYVDAINQFINHENDYNTFEDNRFVVKQVLQTMIQTRLERSEKQLEEL